MTRSTFGATSADFLISIGPGGSLRVRPGTITVWDSATDGTQLTDLLLNDDAVSTIPVDSSGRLPQFLGPDGVVEAWADAGGDIRVRLVTVFTGVTEATDAGVAGLIDDPDSDTAAKLSAAIAAQAEEDVPPLVSAALADDSTIRDTAEAAVIEAADALSIPSIAHADDLADNQRAFRFEGDTADFIAGSTTEGITSPVGGAVFRKIAAESGWMWAFAGTDDRVIFGQRMDGTFYPDTLGQAAPDPATPIIMVGDSLMANRSGSPDSALASTTGRAVLNIGIGSQISTQIIARYGALSVLLTVTGNSIPASGPVTVTATTLGVGIGKHPSTGTWAYPGVLAGIPGTLTATTSDGTTYSYTFTRTTPGAVTPCPAASPFQMGFGQQHYIPIIRVGRNNFTDPTSQIVAEISAALAFTRYPDLAIIESIPPKATETTGTTDRTTLDALNAALKAAFPAQWLDTAAYLRSADTLTLAGITPTSQDTTDIANGITPTSFRLTGDDLHWNASAYTVLNGLYAARLALTDPTT